MTEDELQTRVIDNIRSLRKKQGLSQEKLADKANISRQMMNDIEGRRRWLTKGTLVKLSNALEVDVHELFVPSVQENNNIKNVYEIVTDRIISKVKDVVNVRKAASTDSDQIGQFLPGAELKKLGEEGDWTIIEFQGGKGYVKTEFLE